VPNRRQRTKKQPASAIPKTRPRLAELKAAASTGDRKARKELQEHGQCLAELTAQLLDAWERRPVELKRMEAKASAEPNSQYAENFRQLCQDFDILGAVELLRAAQEKRKKGHPRGENTPAMIYALRNRAANKKSIRQLAREFYPHLTTDKAYSLTKTFMSKHRQEIESDQVK
jgi:hypothetical protein